MKKSESWLHSVGAKITNMVKRRSLHRRRNPLPFSELESAGIAGYHNIRFWGDTASDTFARVLLEKDCQVRAAAESGVTPQSLTEASFLTISGGGDKGAFAGGVLTGWSERGDRPSFEAVIGVSAGALASPFAFLGSDYDDTLLQIYTTLGAKQLYRSRGPIGFFRDALNDTRPLEAVIRRHTTLDLLDRIAVEHRKGRRLFVLTTNLDAQRQVIWNMSGIADSGCPDRHDLFVRILLASSSLPGLFPPVTIDVVTANKKVYDELHVDGGVTAEVIFVPPVVEAFSAESQVFPAGRRRDLFVIENSKLTPDYEAVQMKLVDLAARAVSTLVKYQVIENLASLSNVAKATKSEFHMLSISDNFDATPTDLFNLVRARKLFECGRSAGRLGLWATEVPLSPTHALRLNNYSTAGLPRAVSSPVDE